MKKNKYKIIKGHQNHKMADKHYINGFITNTRLMGVIAMGLHWKENNNEIHQFFHFDAEEYGFDNFESITNGTEIEIENAKAAMSGGLGGEDIEITEKEAKYIFNHYFEINQKNGIEIPKGLKDYAFMIKDKVELNDADKKTVMNKICEEIISDFQLINYFVMRGYGLDKIGTNQLTDRIEFDIFNIIRPATLLRNEIEIIKTNKYHCKALIENNGIHRIDILEIEIDDDKKNKLKIGNAKKIDEMNISDIETSFLLNKAEYITAYNISNTELFTELFSNNMTHALMNSHENGDMYIEFNKNNNHVKEQIYMLNGDIRGCYFITEADQLIVSSYSEEIITTIESEIENSNTNIYLELIDKLSFDKSVLYSYINSGYSNFFEFLSDCEGKRP